MDFDGYNEARRSIDNVSSRQHFDLYFVKQRASAFILLINGFIGTKQVNGKPPKARFFLAHRLFGGDCPLISIDKKMKMIRHQAYLEYYKRVGCVSYFLQEEI